MSGPDKTDDGRKEIIPPHLPPVLWPRPVIVDRFGPRPFDMRLESTLEERAGIAKAFGCLCVDELAAKLVLTRHGSRLKLSGVLEAKLSQACIVTLEPVQAVIREPIAVTFAPPAPVRGGKGRAETMNEEVIQMDVEDPPELILDGTVDLGRTMLEFFALALDPYPRKLGAAFSEKPVKDDAVHPFAALSRLKLGK